MGQATLDGLDTKVTGLEAKVGVLETKVDRMEGKMDNFQQDMTELKESIKDILEIVRFTQETAATRDGVVTPESKLENRIEHGEDRVTAVFRCFSRNAKQSFGIFCCDILYFLHR